MTQATQKMIQQGHVSLVSKDPLILQGNIPFGIRFLRDTNNMGIAGYIGTRRTSNSIDEL